jgi:hypothetical protein
MPAKSTSSLVFKSTGVRLLMVMDKPNKTFNQLRKKNVGPKKYNKKSKATQRAGKRSKKKLKKRNSAIKNIEPGNPKKIRQFNKLIKNNLGHIKLMPLISVIKRVLNLRFMASTNKKELLDSRA